MPISIPASSSSPRSRSPPAVGRNGVSYQATAGTLVVHPEDWNDAAQNGGDKNPDAKDDEHVAGSLDVLRLLRQARRAARGRGRSPSSSTAARAPRRCGCIWARSAQARRDRRRHAHAGRALSAGRQRLQPARCQRPRLHRCAGHRLQPHRRQGQGKGVLRRRSGRARLRRIHPGIPVEIQPLEFAQISVRRKLRHAALGGAGQRSGDRTTTSISTA